MKHCINIIAGLGLLALAKSVAWDLNSAAGLGFIAGGFAIYIYDAIERGWDQ